MILGISDSMYTLGTNISWLSNYVVYSAAFGHSFKNKNFLNGCLTFVSSYNITEHTFYRIRKSKREKELLWLEIFGII